MKRNNIPLDITEKNMSRISLAASIVTLLILCVLIHSIDKNFAAAAANSAADAAARQEEEAALQAEEASVTTANLLVAGDNFYGENLLNAGRRDDGSWNYEDVYSKVRDRISAADLAIVSQPTILTTEHDMVSGTDSYATPTEVGDALAAAGFDVVASAASHSDDYGVNYVEQTLDFWGSSHPDITLLGLHRTQEDADTTQIREVNGIRIALLDYAFGSHFEALPQENSYMIDYFEQEKVTADIQRAASESDCVIVLAQWGDEDNAVPGEYQKEWTQYLLSQGVTAVIGAHSHVLQPYEMLTDGLGHEMLVYYSLGDFANDAQTSPKLLGGLGEFTLEKRIVDGDTRVRVVSATVTPTVMHYNIGENLYQTFLLSNYDDLLAASHSIRETEGNLFSAASLDTLYRHITGLRVSPSYDTDLLGMTCRADGSMTAPDGSVLSADELAYRYPADSSGSLDALRAVMANQAAADSQNVTAADGAGDSDSDSDSGYNSGYDSGDSGYDSDSDSGYDSDSSSGYDSGDSGYDSGSDSGYDSGYDSDSDSG